MQFGLGKHVGVINLPGSPSLLWNGTEENLNEDHCAMGDGSTGLKEIDPFFLKVTATTEMCLELEQSPVGWLFELESPSGFENIHNGLALHSLPCLVHDKCSDFNFHGLQALLGKLSIESLMHVGHIRILSLVDFHSAEIWVSYIQNSGVNTSANFSQIS